MSGQTPQVQTRMLSPVQLITWAEGSVDMVRLRTYRDLIPGGFMAALAPARVDWRSSQISGDDPFVILRNVNYGGNPLEKTTVFHRTRVPLSGIDFVELTLVPSTRGGLHALAHHAQLRFVFKPGKGPVLLGALDSEVGSATRIPDLVLSWETWHESSVRYNGVKGLDSSAYKLSMRAYAGAQRFLEDTLHGRDWFSYRLSMPGGEKGSSELLKVVLALGDGVASDIMSTLLDKAEEDVLAQAPSEESDTSSNSDWQRVRELVLNNRKAEDPLLVFSRGQEDYQTLVRSCATLARYAILTATDRLLHRGVSGEVAPETVPKPVMGDAPDWMRKIAQANFKGMFVRAPLALAYVIRHPESIPDRIPIQLAEAGLVEKRNGKAWVLKYSRKGTNPYDSAGLCRKIDNE